MTIVLLSRRLVLAGLAALAALAFAQAPAAAAECKHRGNLDVRYCDEDGDLTADPPKDPSEFIDPDPLVFSYTPVEDPSVYENVFEEFIAYLAEKTGREVRWYPAESYAAQVEAMRSGRLHIAGISTGPTVFAVNLAGYVPFAIMGRESGLTGYRLQLITQPDSDIKTVADLKGRKVAHVTPSSNSGNQAPRALFKELGVIPDEDYEVVYSGKHDNSILGVAHGDYDAAPVASSVLERMIEKGQLKASDVRIVWQSDIFPTTSYGYVYNLKPELVAKIKDAFFTFDWKGTGLEREFGRQADRFVPITFKDAWKVIRTIQAANGVTYTQESLRALKVKKKKKKKKD